LSRRTDALGVVSWALVEAGSAAARKGADRIVTVMFTRRYVQLALVYICNEYVYIS